jgi:hypothetical protein
MDDDIEEQKRQSEENMMLAMAYEADPEKSKKMEAERQMARECPIPDDIGGEEDEEDDNNNNDDYDESEDML